MPVKEDLKNLNEMIQNMDMQLNTFEELVDSSIENTYHLSLKIKDGISKISKKEIDDMDEADINRLLTNSSDDEINNLSALEDLYTKDTFKDDDKYKDLSLFEFKKRVISDIRDSLNTIAELKNDKERIVNEANFAYENYFNYVNSAEYKEKKKRKLNELKARAEAEEDIITKKKILKKLDTIEQSESLKFLTERLEKYGEKEASNIVDIFFDDKRSRLVMEKFKAKLPRFGYTEEIYKRFLNIEEMFLPEEYHDLNNMFLFHVMRFISFTDTYSEYDGVFVSTILIKIFNLIYHRYEDTEMENEFIKFIISVDDYFMPYIDRFTKFNTTSPNHPERQERDRLYEEKRRMMIISSLENNGITPDTTLDTETLRGMLQDVIDKKEKKTVEETDTVESSEDVINNLVDELPEEASESENSETDNTAYTKESDIAEGTVIIEERKENESLPVIEATTEDLMDLADDISVEVVAYKDGYGNYYIETNENKGEFTYCDEKGEILEEDTIYNEETILRLMSTGSLTKCTLTL